MFKHDLPNGEGTKLFPDGSLYDGNFLDGMFNGKGKLKQTFDNSEYEG